MSCEKHKKSVGSYTDMEKLAEDIGDLHYETLGELLEHLKRKLISDGDKDTEAGRVKLGKELINAGINVIYVSDRIEEAWRISKPYMKETKMGKTKQLEKEYFDLIEGIEEVKREKEPQKKVTIKHPPIIFNEGEWVYSEHFEEANKVKKVGRGNDFVDFHFNYHNGLNCGVLKYCETSGVYRLATKKEIRKRLNKEIDKIKNT